MSARARRKNRNRGLKQGHRRENGPSPRSKVQRLREAELTTEDTLAPGEHVRPDHVGTVDTRTLVATAQAEEFAHLFHKAISDDCGPAADLHHLLESAAAWCRAHDVPSSASELEALVSRLTDLSDELHLVAENVSHEIRSRAYRAESAARLSPAASAWGTSAGRQNGPSAPTSPSAAPSIPRSR